VGVEKQAKKKGDLLGEGVPPKKDKKDRNKSFHTPALSGELVKQGGN